MLPTPKQIVESEHGHILCFVIFLLLILWAVYTSYNNVGKFCLISGWKIGLVECYTVKWYCWNISYSLVENDFFVIFSNSLLKLSPSFFFSKLELYLHHCYYVLWSLKVAKSRDFIVYYKYKIVYCLFMSIYCLLQI